MLPRKRSDLLDFGGRYVFRENAADTFAFPMHFEHDLGRLFATLGKKFLQHDDYKFHGRKVVIAEYHLEHGRRLCLCLTRFKNGAFAMLGSHGVAVGGA